MSTVSICGGFHLLFPVVVQSTAGTSNDGALPLIENEGPRFNFMPELITDVYNKYVAGDLQGSLEAQFKLNPVRLSMDGASFPVAAKDMANLRGRNIGLPYTPNLATPEGPVLDKIKAEMTKAGLL